MAKKTQKGKIAAEIAAGLVAAGAAAAAGYYFYGSTQAKKHRGAAAAWAGNLKKDVVREAKRLKDVDAKDISKIVDSATKTYLAARSVNATDVKRAAKELKSNWELVIREAKKGSRSTVSHTKTAGKRAVVKSKKIVKKVVKKATATARKSR